MNTGIDIIPDRSSTTSANAKSTGPLCCSGLVGGAGRRGRPGRGLADLARKAFPRE